MPEHTEAEQIKNLRAAQAARKAAQIAKGAKGRKRRAAPPSALRQRQAGKAQTAAIDAELQELFDEEAKVVAPSEDTTRQRSRIDSRLREIQGLNQTTDSNNN